jgi:transposase
MIEPLARCSAGLDVHKAQVVCTVLSEEADGSLRKETREYPTFADTLKELSGWLAGVGVELAVMESTGVYWKSVYEALEAREVKVYVVNACHVKHVPGRKTDVLDSEWLAELARCGLLKPSFIPPKDLRELRLLTRYRQKLAGVLCAEKNRLHKVLEDGGIRLGCVVSDIDGVSARKMIEALIEGEQAPEELAELARGRLRGKKGALKRALIGQLSDRHRFLLRGIQAHILWLEARLAELDGQVVAAMQPYGEEWQLLQTIPGIDELSAAMLLVEIGPDMERFGSSEHLSSWAGLCPGNHESAGKKRVAVLDEVIVTSKGSCVKQPIAPERRRANSKGSIAGL